MIVRLLLPESAAETFFYAWIGRGISTNDVIVELKLRVERIYRFCSLSCLDSLIAVCELMQYLL